MTTLVPLTHQEEIEIAYWRARNHWLVCIASEDTSYDDMRDMAAEVQRCFEVVVGWRWSAFRRTHGYVKPISAIRREFAYEIDLVDESRRLTRLNRNGGAE